MFRLGLLEIVGVLFVNDDVDEDIVGTLWHTNDGICCNDEKE